MVENQSIAYLRKSCALLQPVFTAKRKYQAKHVLQIDDVNKKQEAKYPKIEQVVVLPIAMEYDEGFPSIVAKKVPTGARVPSRSEILKTIIMY